MVRGISKAGALIAFLFLCSCATYECYQNYFSNITNYNVCPDTKTNAGYLVDTKEAPKITNEFLLGLDQRLNKIEKCMIEFGYERIKKDCLVIKLVKQRYFSPCSPDEEFLDVPAPQELCDEKGLIENEDCPCMWRVAIQDDNYLIVPYTDDFTKLNIWDVIRIHTGINNFWQSEISTCASF